MGGAASGGVEQFVVFRLGQEEYGLPVASVEEIVRLPDQLTKLPKAPSFVEGVMNIRGKVVPIIDQRQRFETGEGTGRQARVVIVRIGDAEAGFVVDAVSEVLRVPAEALREAPEIASRRSKAIDRIANLDLDGRMVLLIDPQELLDKAEKDMVAAMRRDTSAPS